MPKRPKNKPFSWAPYYKAMEEHERDPVPEPTQRQLQVICLYIQGKNEKDIAEQIHLDLSYVLSELKEGCDMLGVPNQNISNLRYQMERRKISTNPDDHKPRSSYE